MSDASPSESQEPYREITMALAETLSLLRDGMRIRAIARARGVEQSTVRTQVSRLEEITGCHSLDELAAWWERNDRAWLAYVARSVGVAVPTEAETGD